jgi:hypothetical protein
MSLPAIIHSYKYGFGGIGDLFRSVLAFHAVCRQSGVEFYISLEETPDYKACFDLKPIPEDIRVESSEYRQRIAADYRGNAFIQQVVQAAQKKIAVQTVASNVTWLHESALLAVHTPTIQEIIRPSTLVLAKMEEVYARYGLAPGGYASYHVRCGDVYMCKESGKGTSPDIRTRLTPQTMSQYAHLLRQFSEKLGGDLPILIHSDSNEFKHQLQALVEPSGNYIFLDMPIQHVANRLGDNTVESYVSTVAEFYLLVKSAAILMPHYSGFSHIASVLGDVPLYGPLAPNREHQDLLASLGPSKRFAI